MTVVLRLSRNIAGIGLSLSLGATYSAQEPGGQFQRSCLLLKPTLIQWSLLPSGLNTFVVDLGSVAPWSQELPR